MRYGIPVFLSLLLRCTATLTYAHDAPVKLPEPQSAPEAWNVIEQSKANIDQLLTANLMRDIGGQLANISVALRFLHDHPTPQSSDQVTSRTSLLIGAEAGLLGASRDPEIPQQKSRTAWDQWCGDLSRLESIYPSEAVHAQVYICPMHPLDRHLSSTEKCAICGMPLVRRHLPASAVYQKPGEQTLKLTANCPPLVIGKPVTVMLRFAKADGSPVLLSDLIETHTKWIHLLINDRSLGDYHHEHPVPTLTPGEYQFSFTPNRPGPYRVWADVVPAESGVQEYDIVDLPAQSGGQPISDRQTRLTQVVDGRRFELSFELNGQPLRAGQTYIGTMSIHDADGKPFTQLEPVMGAFAHLVGFSEDGRTVLHIHPAGPEPTKSEDRAGPAFAFKFYAPTPGFFRFYCQVRVGGKDVFIPFNLNIAR